MKQPMRNTRSKKEHKDRFVVVSNGVDSIVILNGKFLEVETVDIHLEGFNVKIEHSPERELEDFEGVQGIETFANHLKGVSGVKLSDDGKELLKRFLREFFNVDNARGSNIKTAINKVFHKSSSL